jgi:hypothetical protein
MRDYEREPLYTHNKERIVKGYCRVCWKRFEIMLNVQGMDRNAMLKAVWKRFHCCSQPDLRLI